MRALILRGEPRARARVQAVALRRVRPEIELGLARQGAPGGEGLERQWQLGAHPARTLREVIHDFSPDLIHSHGPLELTVCANELTAGRVPVIHDAEGHAAHTDAERRAVEESAALVVPSQRVLEELAAAYRLPALTCVFPSFPLARELRADGDRRSAEANIDGLASLYEQLVREPLAGFVADLRR
jgi:hypothetical protein